MTAADHAQLEAQRLRHDARAHRSQARRLRQIIEAELDLVQRLRIGSSVHERLALARDCDRQALAITEPWR